MKIQTFVDIVEGKLLNEPSISAFENIRINSNNVRRGDLFIAYSQDDIKDAIDNGAYGVLTEQEVQIIDKEIAWIRVPDLQSAIKRLVDISFTHNHNTCMFLSYFEYDCLHKILSDKKDIVFLSGNIEKDIENLLGDSKDLVFVFKDKNYKNYFRNINYLNSNDIKYDIIKKSLFEVSLVYKGQLFDSIKMPYVFIKNFLSVIEYLSSHKISYSLQGYSSSYFAPLFINDTFEVVDYGKSQKVVVLEREYDYINDGISFIMSAKWAKKIIVLPKSLNNAHIDIDKDTKVFYFKDNSELKSLLKTTIYYVALVFSKDFNINSLKNQTIQHSLFNNF
ncbi:hypothetical protein MNB_ARC-1_961 [hydrothermal vent metagenome]|uniref:Ferrochelatase n=1 Tax=hydrothermal vent metagenome TaxID=652676 RepID=A0A3B1E7J9_9ZZZZ